MTAGGWVFGYGSLVSPESMGTTIGRPVLRSDGFVASVLHGFRRSWNYGSLRQRATWDGANGRIEAGIVVSLGLVPASDDSTNGAIVRVTERELAALDRRESDYDRVEVTDRIEVLPDVDRSAPVRVYTYLPRPSAIERYETARLRRRAAVKQGYVELVEAAFSALGERQVERYRSSTPTPDVPIVDPERVWLEPHPDEPGGATRSARSR